jgi:hypothetical protein
MIEGFDRFLLPRHEVFVRHSNVHLTLGTELQGAFGASGDFAFPSTSTPGSLLRIVLSDYRRGIPCGHRVIGDGSHHHGIGRDNTIAAYCQLSSWAYDGGPMADPSSLANPDCAAFRNALIENRHSDIFVRVIVVHNYDHLAD